MCFYFCLTAVNPEAHRGQISCSGSRASCVSELKFKHKPALPLSQYPQSLPPAFSEGCQTPDILKQP